MKNVLKILQIAALIAIPLLVVGYTIAQDSAADDIAPNWSPDGRQVVFVSYIDGQADIYVMNVSSSNRTRLTSNPTDDLAPVWSPNGRQIAFSSDRDGNQEIYVMNADGSNERNLTNSNSDDIAPQWSMDGRHIVFVSERGGTLNTYVMDADGSDVQSLSDFIGNDSDTASTLECQPTGDRLTGVVYWFNPEKGYGFITPQEGSDIFVHYTGICGSGFRTLSDGQRVEFDVIDGPKGTEARNVIVLDN